MKQKLDFVEFVQACCPGHKPQLSGLTVYVRVLVVLLVIDSYRVCSDILELVLKAGTCARDSRALQQLALNVHVKHSDLT